MLDTIEKKLDMTVEDDPSSGVHRVSRDIFTDPEIFELEMKHIFARRGGTTSLAVPGTGSGVLTRRPKRSA
jgi:hypothetical protein